MGRKQNQNARPYRLTSEALAQRQAAATNRWKALAGASKEERSLPGRPKKKFKPIRDPRTGRFLARTK